MSVISPPPLRKFKSSIMYSIITFPEILICLRDLDQLPPRFSAVSQDKRAWKRALYNGTMIVKVYVLYNMLKVPHILCPHPPPPFIFRTAIKTNKIVCLYSHNLNGSNYTLLDQPKVTIPGSHEKTN